MSKVKLALVASPRTTWAGILQFLTVLSTQLYYVFDTDLSTNPDYNLLIMSVITLIGLIFARDNATTSENAGAK